MLWVGSVPVRNATASVRTRCTWEEKFFRQPKAGNGPFERFGVIEE
jgi:hypothetical protein